MCFTLESALSLASPNRDICAIFQHRFAHKLSLYAIRCDISPLGAQVFLDSGGCLAFADEATRDEAVAVSRAMNVCHYWADWAPTVAELRDGRRTGVLLSASAVVRDLEESSLLVKRDNAAPVEPGKWQFPGVRAQTVNGVEAAVRALTEELAIRDLRTGFDVDRSELLVEESDEQARTVTVYVDGRVNSQHQAMSFLDATCNTLEQFVPVRLSRSGAWYDLRDRVLGRNVAFMDAEAVSAHTSELAMNLRFVRGLMLGKSMIALA